ncbi:MAG: DUF6611 family protein [Mycobacterium sp.]
MTNTQSNQATDPARAHWWIRILDGQREWGSVEVSPTRYGVTRYRLVLFPPGIDHIERRLLRTWRAWPTWGALVWLAVQIGLGAFVTPATAFVVSVIAYLGAGIMLFTRVAELRSRVKTLNVVRMAGYTDEHAAEAFATLKQVLAALCRADDDRAAGRLSPAEHEALWWQVYDQLDPADTHSSR